MLIMTYSGKRQQPNNFSKKVGRPSKKRTGPVSTSLYLQAADNKLMRQAVSILGVSFNGWAIETLRRKARVIVRQYEKQNPTAEV